MHNIRFMFLRISSQDLINFYELPYFSISKRLNICNNVDKYIALNQYEINQ